MKNPKTSVPYSINAARYNKFKLSSRLHSSTNNNDKSAHDLTDYPNLYEVVRLIHDLPSPPIVQVPALPPRNPAKRHTLVLDMDETLIHCKQIIDHNEEVLSHGNSSSFVINARLSSQNIKKIIVKKRPYLDYFLSEVSKHWEVIVFTASHPVCAVPILNTLDSEHTNITHRLYRDACYIAPNQSGSNNYYIKNLNILGRDLRSTLLVDNSFEAFGFQLNNGLLIKTWKDDDPNDDELLQILKVLKRIVDNDMDIPEFIKKNYGYSNLLHPLITK